MKAFITALLLLAITTTPLLSSAQTGDLTIIVTNISEAKGKILIGLYDNEKQFKTMTRHQRHLKPMKSKLNQASSLLPYHP